MQRYEPASPLFVRGVALPPLDDSFFIDNHDLTNSTNSSGTNATSYQLQCSDGHHIPSYLKLSCGIPLDNDPILEAEYDNALASDTDDVSARSAIATTVLSTTANSNSTCTSSTSSTCGSALTASSFAPLVENQIDQAFEQLSIKHNQPASLSSTSTVADALTHSQEMRLRVRVGDFTEMKRKLVMMIEQYAEDASVCARLIALNDRIDDTLAFYSMLSHAAPRRDSQHRLDHDDGEDDKEYDDFDDDDHDDDEDEEYDDFDDDDRPLDDDDDDDNVNNIGNEQVVDGGTTSKTTTTCTETLPALSTSTSTSTANVNPLELSNFLQLFDEQDEAYRDNDSADNQLLATSVTSSSTTCTIVANGHHTSMCLICEEDDQEQWINFPCHTFCASVWSPLTPTGRSKTETDREREREREREYIHTCH
jgi:hypothetical protein